MTAEIEPRVLAARIHSELEETERTKDDKLRKQIRQALARPVQETAVRPIKTRKMGDDINRRFVPVIIF